MKAWTDLPESFQTEALRPYYESLSKKKGYMAFRRLFDVTASGLMMVLLSPVMAGLALWIKSDSKGPVIFRQTRITQYGRSFQICKFRTMSSSQSGASVTAKGDARITKAGRFLRKYRLDELPQLVNVFKGEMAFVGTRPEVPEYVDAYNEEMKATLLVPAGITSKASVAFKDEESILENAKDVSQAYIQDVLPQKMAINLEQLKNFGLKDDLKTLYDTVAGVFF